jgi:hypothetical protein
MNLQMIMIKAAIADRITTVNKAEELLHLDRVEDPAFFPEWSEEFPPLTPSEQTALLQLRQRYLYHRLEAQLLEGTVTLLLVSPLLTLAGIYDPPFRMEAERGIEIQLDDSEENDSEESLRGRIDVLTLQDQLWVLVLESKKTALSVWSALPQTLTYLAASPRSQKAVYGLITNGDDILFVKLTQISDRQYSVSRTFSVPTSAQELQLVLQILKRIAQEIKLG